MVKCSQTVVKERTILKCSWDDSFGSLLLKFGCDDLEAETIHEVIASNNDKFIDPRHKVPIDAPVSVCDQFGCMYVYLYLTEKETTRPPLSSNTAPASCVPCCYIGVVGRIVPRSNCSPFVINQM